MKKFRFSLISDMHIDHPQEKTPYDKLEKFVVVAGDTGNGLTGVKFLKKLQNKGFEVFAVDGNHEHYANARDGRSEPDTTIAFYQLTDLPAVLNPVPGLKLISANGWYPVTDEKRWQGWMNDSRRSGLSGEQATALAVRHAEFVRSQIDNHDGKVIVVTHTAPCEHTLNPQYDGHFSNEWFWNPHMLEVLKDRANKILVWCHGHTHAAADKIAHGVRVVCNPRGYPGENPGWTPKTIEVEY